jgi:hypothetical protein
LRRDSHSSKGVLPSILTRLQNLVCEAARVLTRTAETLMMMMMMMTTILQKCTASHTKGMAALGLRVYNPYIFFSCVTENEENLYGDVAVFVMIRGTTHQAPDTRKYDSTTR